jgi:uncharacterized protein YegL
MIPMRRNFGDLSERQILPFYFVCEESESMDSMGGIAAMNQALPDIHAEIASNPLVADKCLLGVIGFADNAEELMTLTHLSDVVDMPGFRSRGDCRYSPVFTLLKEVIARDVEDLKSCGAEVIRPAVFFITGGEPTDDPAWENSYRSLMDKATFRQYPNIIAFGVHGANASVIGEVGSVGAFIGDNGVTPVGLVSEILTSLITGSCQKL